MYNIISLKGFFSLLASRFLFLVSCFSMDEYYYSGSDFYNEDDVQAISSFSDVSEMSCLHPDRVRYKARRYGQWWTLTGISPTCASPSEAQELLRLEYTRLITLRHPHVTRVVAMVEVPWLHGECVVEEFIDGQPLQAFMQGQPNEEQRLNVLSQTVDALRYCHSKHIAHGNLSASAVMITHQDSQARLVDFSYSENLATDTHAMADIIDTLQLPKFNRVAYKCRDGSIDTAEALQRAIEQPLQRSRMWLMPVVCAIIALVIALAFWAGHRASLSTSSLATDSLPLPGIYFSDTVNLSERIGLLQFYSTLTGANIYFLDWSGTIPTNIPDSEAIDLGLSVLWAPFNVGCDHADVNHVGFYCTWCDTTGMGAFKPLDSYWPPAHVMLDISGTRHDPVRHYWGGKWRMPTYDEIVELHDRCVWTLVRHRGIPMGYKVRGPKGTSIFMPLAGYRLRYREHEIGVVGRYWSSTPVTNCDREVYALKLDTTVINFADTVSIEYSLSIRPVLDRP